MKKIFLLTLSTFWAFVNFSQSTTTVSLKPNGAVGEDTYVYKLDGDCIPSGMSTTTAILNYGNRSEISIADWTFSAFGCGTGTLRSFIRFTEIADLPEGAAITEAKLVLKTPSSTILFPFNSYYPGTSYPNPNPGTLYRVSPGSANNWNEHTITWNSHLDVGIDWTASAPLAVTTSKWSFTQEVDVTDIVNSIYNDIHSGVAFANNGFFLKLNTEDIYRNHVYASSDHTDSTNWPELIITYTLEDYCDASFDYTNTSDANFSFDALSSTGMNYNWFVNDVYKGTGAAWNYSFPAIGTYNVCLRVMFNNKDECEECKTVNVTTLNIDERTTNINNLMISPNPTSNNWQVVFESKFNDAIKVSTYALDGRLINDFNKTIHVGKNSFEVSGLNLPQGIYLLKIEGKKITQSVLLNKL